LNAEAALKGFAVPSYLRRWINLKKVFPTPEELKEDSLKASSAKWRFLFQEKTVRKPVASGMEDMLTQLKLSLDGQHHSGIDDSKNLVKVVLHLLERGFQFSQCMVYASSTK
jgi:ERI1 exoribonuclease 3